MAAFNIDYVNYKPREYVAQPLEALRATTESLEAKHQSALQQENAVMQYMGSLDLNEAEDKWRTDYINNNIITPIEQASQYGNLATAMTTATRIASKVASDPALRERVRYQKDYTEFKNSVQNSKDYDDSIKEYTLAHNTYNYYDKIDDKTGQVIGGSRFEPINRPVKQIDYVNEIFMPALRTVAKDAGGSEDIYYTDGKGGYTTDSNKSPDGDLAYYKKGNSFERISKEKLAAAVEAMIANTPGARESVAQDYKVGMWKTQQAAMRTGDLQINAFTDDKGIFLSEEQYLQKRLDPFYKSATYNNVRTNIDPLDGMKYRWQMALRKKQGEISADDLLKGNVKVPGGIISRVAATISEIGGTRQNLASGIDNMLADLNVSYNSTDDMPTRISKLNAYINTIQDEAAKIGLLNQAGSLIRQYNDFDARYTELVGDLPKTAKYAIDFKSVMDGNGDLTSLVSSENTFAQDYIKGKNNFFGEKGETATFKIKGVDRGNLVISALDEGVINGAKNNGFIINRTDNGVEITINKNNANLVKLNNALELGDVDSTTQLKIEVYDKNNNALGGIASDLFGGKYTHRKTVDRFAEAIRPYYKADKNSYKVTERNIEGEINRGFDVYTRGDLGNYMLANAPYNTYADMNAALKDYDKQVLNGYASADFAQREMYAGVKGGANIDITTGGRRSAIGIFMAKKMADEPGNVTNTFSDNIDGSPASISTWNGELTDKDIDQLKGAGFSNDELKNMTQLKIVVKNLISDDLSYMLKNDPEYQSKIKISQSERAGLNKMTIYNGAFGTSTLNMNQGKYSITNANGSTVPVSYDDAVKIAASNNDLMILEYTLNNLSYNKASQEAIDKLFDTAVPIISRQTGYTNLEQIGSIFRNMFKD